jgi:hypothetical protein
MIYTSQEPEKGFACTSPRVKKMWEFGSMSNGYAIYNICIILDDNLRYDFKGTEPDIVIEMAERFLIKLDKPVPA